MVQKDGLGGMLINIVHKLLKFCFTISIMDIDGYPVLHIINSWKEHVPAANEWCEEMGASVMEEIMEDLDGFAEAQLQPPCG